MPLPLFGFGGGQVRATPVLRNRPPQGFFDQLGSAFKENFARTQTEQATLELQQGRQDFTRNETAKAHQFQVHADTLKRKQDIDDEVAAGTRVPATPEALAFLKRMLPEDELGEPIITLSDGEQVINPLKWARAQALRAATSETINIDVESIVSATGTLSDFGIDIDTQAILDPDGDSLVSPAQLAALEATLSIVSPIADRIQKERDSVRDALTAALGRGTGTAKVETDYIEAVNKLTAAESLSVQIIDKETDEELFGSEKYRKLQERNLLILNPFEAADPVKLGEINARYSFTDMPTANAALESAAKIVKEVMSSQAEAQGYLSNVAQPVINRLGPEIVREVMNSNSQTNSDIVFSDLLRRRSEFVKAMMLMSVHKDGASLEQYFRELGGYQAFRSFYDGSVIDLIKRLDPENFGSFDAKAATLGLGNPQPGPGLDPVAENDAVSGDSIAAFVVANPSAASQLEQGGLSTIDSNQQVQSMLNEAFTLSMERDPQAAQQLTELVRAIMDPTIGQDIILKEIAETRQLGNAPGVYSPEEVVALNAALDAWEDLIRENSGDLPTTLGPIASDALIKAEEALAR